MYLLIVDIILRLMHVLPKQMANLSGLRDTGRSETIAGLLWLRWARQYTFPVQLHPNRRRELATAQMRENISPFANMLLDFQVGRKCNERYVNGGLIKGGPSSQTFSGTLADFVCDFWRKTSDVTSEFWIALQTEFK